MRYPLNSARKQDGFTLLEVMIAMMMLGFGLLTMAAAQTSAMKMNSQSQFVSQATYLAQERLDEIMMRPTNDPIFQASGLVPALTENDLQIPGAAVADPELVRYDRRVTVFLNQPANFQITIAVDVDWKSGAGGVGVAEVFRTVRVQSVR